MSVRRLDANRQRTETADRCRQMGLHGVQLLHQSSSASSHVPLSGSPLLLGSLTENEKEPLILSQVPCSNGLILWARTHQRHQQPLSQKEINVPVALGKVALLSDTALDSLGLS